MNAQELFWEFLPNGLQDYFDIKGCEKTAKEFRVVLFEKNSPGEVPEKYRGKRILDSTLDEITIDDFPVRGRKGILVLKRRSWKFEGVDEWYRRDIKITAPGTKLEKEFANFLKELDRKHPFGNQQDRRSESPQTQQSSKTVS
jgi:hypothetical protein